MFLYSSLCVIVRCGILSDWSDWSASGRLVSDPSVLSVVCHLKDKLEQVLTLPTIPACCEELILPPPLFQPAGRHRFQINQRVRVIILPQQIFEERTRSCQNNFVSFYSLFVCSSQGDRELLVIFKFLKLCTYVCCEVIPL